MREKYLNLLAETYGTKEEIITEIINLEAILSLPKATEHFVSDLHGEYDAFDHVMRNGSGNVKRKIKDVMEGRISQEELAHLITLVYYPKERLLYHKKEAESYTALTQWYTRVITWLVEIAIHSSSKYTRSKVRKSFPSPFAYIMEELIFNLGNSADKEDYYDEVVCKVIGLGQADNLITAFCYTIQRLVVDHVHVVGDIYDRGPHPDKIMESLMAHHSVDLQWGNHDLLWMGAVSGSKVCMANLLRICARYHNLDIVEDAYGINLRPLQTFAEKHYEDNPVFRPQMTPGTGRWTEEEIRQSTKIQQAMAIIQFKLEREIIQRRPEFDMEHRRLLERVDYQNLTLELDGTVYPLTNTCFSTIDPENPTALTDEEKQLVDRLLVAFQSSEKLARHMDFFFRKGSLYLIYNDNLLIHGCIPLTEQGYLDSMVIQGTEHTGKELLDCFEHHVRQAYRRPYIHDDYSTDLVWYLWTGAKSSLFGKQEMTTFERYFIQDKVTHHERMNPYFLLREQVEVCDYILENFGIDPQVGHIVNGHTPIKELDGESPIKAEGKVIVIDGGFSRAYHDTTGIGGYTLLYNSYGMELAAHQPFTSRQDAIENGTDIVSTRRVVDEVARRKRIRETNIGRKLSSKSYDLNQLLKHMTASKKSIYD